MGVLEGDWRRGSLRKESLLYRIRKRTRMTVDGWETDALDINSWQSIVVATGMLGCFFPLFTFYGQRLFIHVLSLASALGGAYGTYVLLLKTGGYDAMPHPVSDLLIVTAGLTLGSLAWLVEHVGMFALGAVSGALGSNLVYQYVVMLDTVRDIDAVHISVIATTACLAGITLVILRLDIERIVTAFAGSYFGVASLDYFLTLVGREKGFAPLDSNPTFWPSYFFESNARFECASVLCYVLLGVWGCLFISGVLVQYLVTSRSTGKYEPLRGETEPLLGETANAPPPKQKGLSRFRIRNKSRDKYLTT